MSEVNIASPLQRKRVLVTRTREQASLFSERLRALGAIPIEFPTIRIVPPANWAQLDAAIKQLYVASYDWLILTSVNGVNILFDRVQALGYEPQQLQQTLHVRIATIGPATAQALASYGLTATLVPDEYRAEAITQALLRDAGHRNISLRGQRILLARAAEARKVLTHELLQQGALVDEVPTYFTHGAAPKDEQSTVVWQMLLDRQIDILTFTSSSTVRNFIAWLENVEKTNEELDIRSILPPIACIGPITAQTARDMGLPVAIEASTFTIDGLVAALLQLAQKETH